MDQTPTQDRTITKHTLNQLHELRIQITSDQSLVTVTLLNGSCESFGTNMVQTLTYELGTPGSYSFFTWSGCELEIIGTPHLLYTTNDTSFPIIANINHELEKDRRHSDNNNIAGPSVLCLGRQETGKTSILRTLCHYSLRTGWNPTYIDINPASNNLSIPGTITATPIEMQSKPKHLNKFSHITPLVYFYGHTTIENNTDLFTQQCKSLSKQIEQRVLGEQMRGTDFPGYTSKSETLPIPAPLIPTTKHAGIFIDTPAELCTMANNINIIESICTAFHVNLILVVDDEPLHAKLIQYKPFTTLNNGIAISRIPKLLGAVTQTEEQRLWAQKAQIQAYFYGKKSQYTPFSDSISLTTTSIYSTAPAMVVPLTALPLGTADDFHAKLSLKLDKLTYDELKPNTIMALSYGTSEDDLATMPVAGFVHIQEIPHQNDPVRKIREPILYCLFPNRAPPRHLTQFLLGSIAWSGY